MWTSFCPLQLAQRRETSAHASTSQPQRPCVQVHSYAFGYQGNGESKAKALSIPWEASSGNLTESKPSLGLLSVTHCLVTLPSRPLWGYQILESPVQSSWSILKPEKASADEIWDDTGQSYEGQRIVGVKKNTDGSAASRAKPKALKINQDLMLVRHSSACRSQVKRLLQGMNTSERCYEATISNIAWPRGILCQA